MTLYYDRVSLLKITEKSQVSETLHNSSKYLIWFEVKMTKRDPKSAELRWTIKRCESREKKIARKLAWSYIQCLIGCVCPCGFFISVLTNVRNKHIYRRNSYNLSKYWFAHSYMSPPMNRRSPPKYPKGIQWLLPWVFRRSRQNLSELISKKCTKNLIPLKALYLATILSFYISAYIW